MEKTMTSRFSLVQAPPQAPGHCYITKTAIGPFIDTGMDMSIHVVDRGRLYLSVDVVREMAQIAGLFDEKEPVTVELKQKQWYDKGYNDAMKEINQDAVNRFIEHAVYSSAGAASDPTVVESAGHFSTAGAAIPSPADATAGASESDQDVDGLELESTSVGSFERPVGVPADSGDESDYRL